ncbi:hypothetical protein C1H76_0283 [Elsinoe australis]|uniref:DUF8004 domain-containing protein n=1 Tax=Elsinoe australis TaxID=40998 RepID=A0A4U7BEC9_9PEZI|nr:hypothetical protein C1H76_0283 [Elsinoe australis]
MSQPSTPVATPAMAPGFLDFIQNTAPVYPSPPILPPLRTMSRGRRADTEPCSPSIRSRPGSSSSASSVPNFSRVMSQRKASVPELSKLSGIQPIRRTPTARRKSTVIKRWDGVTRRAVQWDSLRRDAELYDPQATCAVHFHGRGRSQRGPSLRVPIEVVAKSGCLAALRSRRESSGSESPASDSGYSSHGSQEETHHLFIGAPEYLSRDEAHQWHITTRNIFAWMMDKPLVGYSLGQSLIDLLERLLTIRSATSDGVRDCVAYAERMGYVNMSNQPDYALAMLSFAEHFRLPDLWTNAFVHCAGMNDILYQSSELDSISKQTQAAITKAYLKMDLKVEKVTRNLGNFLEDDLSPSRLGLTSSQRGHLDRFRSFIHTFYVNKLGYWPPTEFTDDLLQTMRHEFECLYDLLVDNESSTNLPNATSGGLCVLQNVATFDSRHDYQPLAHPLPLNPQHGALDGKAFATRGFRSFLASRNSRRELMASARSGLDAATNKANPHIRKCALVQAYLPFEQESLSHLELDLAIADARKVRWIQIYYLLQALKSVTSSPPQFTTSLHSTLSYNTCCAVPPIPWSSGRSSVLSVHPALRSSPPSESSLPPSPSAPQGQNDPSPHLSIHPDCSRDDYFVTKSPIARPHSRTDSATSLAPLPLRLNSPALSRATSFIGIGRRTSILSLKSRTGAGGRETKRSSIFSSGGAPSEAAQDEHEHSPASTSENEEEPIAENDELVFDLPIGARTPTLDFAKMAAMSEDVGPFELDAVEPMLDFLGQAGNGSVDEDVLYRERMRDFEFTDLPADMGMGLTKGDLCEFDGESAGTRRSSLSGGSSGSEYSEYRGSSDGESEETSRTALTPVLEMESPGGSEAWAGDYRRCLGGEDGYFAMRKEGESDEEEEDEFWIDVPRR